MTPLTDREKEVMRLRYGLGQEREYTLEEVGRRLGITRERARQISFQRWQADSDVVFDYRLADYAGKELRLGFRLPGRVIGVPARSMTSTAMAPRALLGSNTGALTSVSAWTGLARPRKAASTRVLTRL